VFTSATQSPAKPPVNFLPKDFDSTKQSYELFVPKRKDSKQPAPAILFISAANDPQGWKTFEKPCKDLGYVFIGVRGAGNDVPGPKRCRIVLDCLDDVRRQIPLDPDRTYIAGFSGGARMACAIGFALPELFGGILPICASGDLRPEPWLRHRAIDRLSVALVTGTTDFNRGEVERWRGAFYKEIGIRTRVWTPSVGHTLPPTAIATEAIKWLEESRGKRAELAKKHAATRSSPDVASDRESAAKALLAEGQEKVKSKETLHAGLMLMKGVLERWPDLPAAADAKKTLLEYEGKSDRTWEKEDIAEQLKYYTAEARSLGDYALKGIPEASQYAKQRPNLAKRAIELWTVVISASADSAIAKEGKEKIAELEKISQN
jgi:pimeloyl-ACP methyl ester carboxylesterase